MTRRSKERPMPTRTKPVALNKLDLIFNSQIKVKMRFTNAPQKLVYKYDRSYPAGYDSKGVLQSNPLFPIFIISQPFIDLSMEVLPN